MVLARHESQWGGELVCFDPCALLMFVSSQGNYGCLLCCSCFVPMNFYCTGFVCVASLFITGVMLVETELPLCKAANCS